MFPSLNPPPSPYPPSGSSQCTSPKHPVSCIEAGLATHFIHDILHVSMPFSQMISFRMDWLDLLAVRGTLKSLLQHHNSKASILLFSAFFTVQVSYPYMTTGKTIVLTRWTFIGKVMSLLFNMLSELVIAFFPSIFSFHGCSHHLQ